MNGCVPQELTHLIDIGCVKPDYSLLQISEMLALARQYRLMCAYSLGCFTSHLVEALREDPDISVGGLVSFPHGCDTTTAKVRQTEELITLGCAELDMVVNLPLLRDASLEGAYRDIKAVVDAAVDVPVRVILEPSLMTQEEIANGCKVAISAGAAYIRLGTGWQDSPVTCDDVALVRRTVQDDAGIIAAGGIDRLEKLLALQQAGCDRFCLSPAEARPVLRQLQASLV